MPATAPAGSATSTRWPCSTIPRQQRSPGSTTSPFPNRRTHSTRPPCSISPYSGCGSATARRSPIRTAWSAAARHMRARSLPILPIPANYYDDLAARVDLDSSLLDAMREHDVLYDRSQSGEFYHFYTVMLGRRVFFELVQRLGDYDGYGAVNTPVRMAAQYRNTAMAGVR